LTYHHIDTHEDKQLRTIAAIPCLNTELSIGSVVTEAGKYVDTVVVIDDGSDDATAGIARDAGAVVIRHLANRGYGGAIMSCFEAAKSSNADVLVILDGDGQHKPEEIPHLVEPIADGKADMTIGSRLCTESSGVPGYRRCGIKIITWLFNFGSGIKVTDSQSGFRAYKSNVYKDFCLSEKGMSISIETLEAARRNGAVIREVPINCVYHHSNMNSHDIKHGIEVAWGVVRIRCRQDIRTGEKIEDPLCQRIL
jgi:glycosyltransferase involved in cell wall biosynthesis